MQTTALPPVRKNIEVSTTPERAFTIFTTDMHRWWPNCSDHAIDRVAVVLEPKVGGQWYERNSKGVESHWGRVLAWNPPTGLVLAWQIDLEQKFDPSLVTEVEISFVATESGKTRVSVEHRHLERFGVRAEAAREIYDSTNAWVGVLEALREATLAG